MNDKIIHNGGWFMRFNEILKSLRENTDLNQKDLADKLNINPATYRNYENGNREPDFAILITIARFFNVTTDYLLGESEFKTYESMKKSQLIEDLQLSDDEKQLLLMYRKLSDITKAEIRGEIKGILRMTEEEHSDVSPNENISNKKVI